MGLNTESTHSLLFLSCRVILCQKRKSILTNYNGVVSTNGRARATSQPADTHLILSAFFSLFFSFLKRPLGCLDDGWYTKECGEYRKTNMYFETLNWTSFPWIWSILTILLCPNIYIYIYIYILYIYIIKEKQISDLQKGKDFPT